MWGLDANADARTVLVHISNLRAKLRGGRGRGKHSNPAGGKPGLPPDAGSRKGMGVNL